MEVMLRWRIFSCRWTCTWCSAGGSSLAVEHVLDAPLEDLLLPLNMYLMLRWRIFSKLRRMNLMRSSATDKIEHRNVLCAHYLNKEPGLRRMLRALKMHREKAAAGLISPGNCFKKPLWDFWRLTDAKKTWVSSCPSWSWWSRSTTIAMIFNRYVDFVPQPPVFLLVHELGKNKHYKNSMPLPVTLLIRNMKFHR